MSLNEDNRTEEYSIDRKNTVDMSPTPRHRQLSQFVVGSPKKKEKLHVTISNLIEYVDIESFKNITPKVESQINVWVNPKKDRCVSCGCVLF